jgi:hypothetical protein
MKDLELRRLCVGPVQALLGAFVPPKVDIMLEFGVADFTFNRHKASVTAS